jgi:hypothetical protein
LLDHSVRAHDRKGRVFNVGIHPSSMTSTPTNKFTALRNEEILYNYYSYDAPQYMIDMLKVLYETYKNQGQGKDQLFHKKCSILKFEIVAKFCHYAEALGSFLYPCHSLDPDLRPAAILENLSKYKVFEIDRFFRELNQQGYSLDRSKRNNFNLLFGYSRVRPAQAGVFIVAGSHYNFATLASLC